MISIFKAQAKFLSLHGGGSFAKLKKPSCRYMPAKHYGWQVSMPLSIRVKKNWFFKDSNFKKRASIEPVKIKVKSPESQSTPRIFAFDGLTNQEQAK